MKQDPNQFVEQEANKIERRFKPHYHISAESGWLNDPNGLVYFKGEYHVFFQHHPYSAKWGPMHWGHVKSKDLVHWERCPIALEPGNDYDKNGCFSGSAIVHEDKLYLIYTGHVYTIGENEPDIFTENQNIAISSDGVHFEKYQGNPVIAAPPSDSAHHFRDPKVWKEDDTFYMILGNATPDEHGRVILYQSDNLLDWEYVGVLNDTKPLGFMWECPDFFPLDDQYVLSFSPMGLKQSGDRFANIFQTGYMIGSYDKDEHHLQAGQFYEMDHGHDFYALQTFEDDKHRRIAVAWLDMWETPFYEEADGWSGMLTLPRELSIGPDGNIWQSPVAELENLRLEEITHIQEHLHSKEVSLDTHQAEVLLKMGKTGNHQSIKITDQEDLELSLDFDHNNNKVALIRNGQVRRTNLEIEDTIEVRVFLDSSSVEIFLQGGQVTFSSRIFPVGNLKLTFENRELTDTDCVVYQLDQVIH